LVLLTAVSFQVVDCWKFSSSAYFRH